MLQKYVEGLAANAIALPVGVATFFAGAIIFLIFQRRSRGPWKTVLYVALILGMCEFGVFRNPVFFNVCRHNLNADDIGYKQRDAVSMEIRKRTRPQPSKYVAIGSSQVWAVFYQYALQHDDLEWISVAGMGAAEYPAFYEFIELHHPETVLLYLSDSDLGRDYRADSFKLFPPKSPRDLFAISRMLREKDSATVWEIVDLWTATYVSLYRYQFIFKGVLNKFLREKKAFAEAPAPADSHETLEENSTIPEGLLRMTDSWFDVNLAAVDRFIAWCDNRELKVVVIQGHYHPEAVAQRLELRSKARELLEEICASHPNARFLGEERLHAFTIEDYLDGSHVRLESGAEFAAALMARLASEEEAD